MKKYIVLGYLLASAQSVSGTSNDLLNVETLVHEDSAQFTAIMTTKNQRFFGTTALVGLASDNSCTHNSIAAAIADGATDIRVVNSTFNENLSISNSNLSLVGGFVNCASASVNSITTFSTTIDGINGTNMPVIEVSNDGNSYQLHFQNLILRNGSAIQFGRGAGLILAGNDTEATLERLTILENTGSGLVLDGATAVAKDVGILSNEAPYGAGVFCDGGGLVMHGRSTISANSAFIPTRNNGQTRGNNLFGNGGGLLATNSCLAYIFSGLSQLSSGLNGISFNTASNLGGGIYADQSSELFLLGHELNLFGSPMGTKDEPFAMIANESQGKGGGIYMAGTNTAITISGVNITRNIANADDGGAAAVLDGAQLTFVRQNLACWNTIQCNRVFFNEAGPESDGGAFYFDSASAGIGNVYFDKNVADNGTAIMAINGSQLQFEGSIFHDNSPRGTGLGAYVGVFVDSTVSIGFSTFVDNFPGESTLFVAFTDFTLVGSVIHEVNGSPVYELFSPSSMVNDCLYVHNDANINGTNFQTSINDPFLDRANDDFHVGLFSLRDACDTLEYSPSLSDMDRELRGFEDPISNIDGPYDIGADEDYSSDVIFKSSFD